MLGGYNRVRLLRPGEGSGVGGVGSCGAYLRVGLLLLLLADEGLQSLHRVRGDAERRRQLLLEALHPH